MERLDQAAMSSLLGEMAGVRSKFLFGGGGRGVAVKDA